MCVCVRVCVCVCVHVCVYARVCVSHTPATRACHDPVVSRDEDQHPRRPAGPAHVFPTSYSADATFRDPFPTVAPAPPTVHSYHAHHPYPSWSATSCPPPPPPPPPHALVPVYPEAPWPRFRLVYGGVNSRMMRVRERKSGADVAVSPYAVFRVPLIFPNVMCVCIHACVCVHICMCVCVCLCVCVCVYIHIRTCICIRI